MFASHRCPRFPWPRSLAGGVPAKPRPSRRSADALVRARCRCCGKCPGSANCGLTVRCLGAVWEKFCDRHGGLADEGVCAPLNCLVPAYAVRASSGWPSSPGRCGGGSPDAPLQDGQRADLWPATRTKTGFGGAHLFIVAVCPCWVCCRRTQRSPRQAGMWSCRTEAGGPLSPGERDSVTAGNLHAEEPQGDCAARDKPALTPALSPKERESRCQPRSRPQTQGKRTVR
jgi:hypothetical protein